MDDWGRAMPPAHVRMVQSQCCGGNRGREGAGCWGTPWVLWPSDEIKRAHLENKEHADKPRRALHSVHLAEGLVEINKLINNLTECEHLC